jgi:N6-adenosine-specific RNA methylase IME4
MTDADVAALPVGDLLAPAAIVALWVTNSVLVEGRHLPVLRAWGLVGKQLVPWVKTTRGGGVRFGMGHYTRVCSEHLIYAAREGDAEGAGRCVILATRGRAATLVGDHSVAGLVVGPPRAGVHSSKPDAARDLLDALVPEGPRVEVFSRAARQGWDAVGDQAQAPAGEAVAS